MFGLLGEYPFKFFAFRWGNAFWSEENDLELGMVNKNLVSVLKIAELFT